MPMSKRKKILLMLAKGGASQSEVAAALHASKRDVSAGNVQFLVRFDRGTASGQGKGRRTRYDSSCLDSSGPEEDMPEPTVTFNEKVLKSDLRKLVRRTVEDFQNGLVEEAAGDLAGTGRYE